MLSKTKIIQAVIEGTLNLSELVEADARFARAVHVSLMESSEPNLDDIELLHVVLDELS